MHIFPTFVAKSIFVKYLQAYTCQINIKQDEKWKRKVYIPATREFFYLAT